MVSRLNPVLTGYYDGDKTKRGQYNYFLCTWIQHRWRGQSQRQQKVLWILFLTVLFVGTTAVILLTIVNIVLPPPELYYAETFQLQDIQLPPQCAEVVTKLKASSRSIITNDRPPVPQLQDQEDEEEEEVRLVACHRKWCQSWGHCDPCTGIGDRTRALMNKVQRVVEEEDSNVKIQLDYPLNDCDMAVLESTVFIDPSGWFGEMFHYRSYQNPDEHPVLHLRPRRPRSRQERQRQQRVGVTGFFNKPINNVHDYNACYFHTLFQPGRRLRTEIQKHETSIGSGPSIGLHYRTGDVAAFGMSDHDNRVAGERVLDGWYRMLQCGHVLASRLFPETPIDQITFYVATDNLPLKQQLRLQQWRGDGNGDNSSSSNNSNGDDRNTFITTDKDKSTTGRIYVTDVIPNHSTQGSDRDAWLELYLLSHRQGLVANVNHVSTNYDPDGGAKYPISKFAVLAAKIGFFEPHELIPCDLEDDDEITRDNHGNQQQQQQQQQKRQHKRSDDDNRKIVWY